MNHEMEMIKEEIRTLDPELRGDDPLYQTLAVLMAAAFVTGPVTDRLSSFTGYSPGLVADISRRMHNAGRWKDGTVETDHWFDGDNWAPGFYTDTLLAEGQLVAQVRQDGQREFRVPEKSEKQ